MQKKINQNFNSTENMPYSESMNIRNIPTLQDIKAGIQVSACACKMLSKCLLTRTVWLITTSDPLEQSKAPRNLLQQ